MNVVLFLIGLGILGKGVVDFQSALLGTTTFDDIISKDMYFEAGYYYFGFVYGAVCAFAVKSGKLKIFSSTVGLICLLISGYVIIDSYNETKGAAEKCGSHGQADLVTECLEKLTPEN
ncbi:hypothetical protein BZG00_02085 [Salinivibrio kushneri]|uniref:Uncharacterized protein n=1 Tax=Salinivibrio kushneri TaxID=1908198 RepID=A0AB36K2K6_9GAMM|nr:hypothetical protein [Salinivibrio kushneri]OOE41779.1 hypothetical protein BZG00_02085 [Salinivibrio kushneri]QCP02328.1 hypothetical protein FCN78_07905 [Salinivibrio kushneri]